MRQINGQNAFDIIETIDISAADWVPNGDVCYRVYVSVAGNIKLTTPKVTTAAVFAVPVGWLELTINKIVRVGTTATLTIALS